MQDNNFKEIMQLDIDITNKLLSYMQARISFVDVFDKFDTQFLHAKDGNLALNIWLSIDYVDKNGKNFVEKMLADKSLSLTKTEKEILNEKANSFVSLYEIRGFETDHVLLRDILNNKEYKLLEPSIHKIIKIGGFLFTRIGKVLDNYIFMGDINYLPSQVKDYFLEELLIDYNLIRKDKNHLTMIEYLKEYSLNLYRIYNEILIDIVDDDGDIHSLVFDELDEFEEFLLAKYDDIGVKKHLNNLINIFDYVLSDNEMTLYDIDDLDLDSFFNEAIKDSFINSQEEFNSYITTLKSYLQFLSIGDPQYRESYDNMLVISKDRFKYLSKLDTQNSFTLDRNLASSISFRLNEQAISLLMDYDKFILYISDANLKLTSSKKHLKRRDLLQLNQIFDNESVVDSKAPNQKDFILINLFFYVSLKNNIFEIQDNDLIVTNKGFSLIRLADEEKYALLVQYLLGKDFMKLLYSSSNNYIIENTKNEIIEILSTLKADNQYAVDETPLNLSFVFNDYVNYLLVFGLMTISFQPTLIGITSLGKNVFKYITHKKDMVRNTGIIKLDDFKRIKNNMEG